MNVNSSSLAKVSLWSATAVSAVGAVAFWPNWIGMIISLAMWLPLAMLFALIAGFVLHAMGATQDVAKLWVDDDKINIKEKGPVLGTINGVEFFEYVILVRPDNQETVRCDYDSVVDMDKGFDPPADRWFIMSEGALYIQPESTMKASDIA